MTKRVFFNPDLCCGCKSCAAACSYGYYDHGRVGHSNIAGQALIPLVCLHCEQPTCVAACPREAMQKDEDGSGEVKRAAFLCSGCLSCSLACPFGIVPPDLKYHIVPKCDQCQSRTLEGKLPRCVATCTSGALSFEDIDERAKDEKKLMISGRITAITIGRRR